MVDWELAIDCLADAVLWDRDFEIEAHLDADPQESAAIKSVMGISPNYYSAVPLDPPDHQLNLYLDALMGLTPRGRARHVSPAEPTDGLF